MGKEEEKLAHEVNKLYKKKKKGYTGKHTFERPSTGKEAGNRVDYIEDFLGTEELSGTYETRKEFAKSLKHEKQLVAEYNRKKFEQIRKERESKLRDDLKRSNVYDIINRQLDFLMPFVLEPTAFEYLKDMYRTEPKVAHQIFWHIFPPNELEQLGAYVEHVQRTGRGPKVKVSLTRIMRIERKIKGIKNKIMIDRDGKKEEIFKGRKVA